MTLDKEPSMFIFTIRLGTSLAAAGLAFALAAPVAIPATPAEACGPSLDLEAPRRIELALCLDTSGSMDGLIDAAKQKLWSIVNDLAQATPTPDLRVALLTFGNDGHTPENGWVKVNTAFTDDLDLVSRELFALQTNGGTELVGRVLHHAGQLDWHPSEDALKLAVVAGNESADQDQEMPYADVCKSLITRGIMVNSIYCGPALDEIAPGWKQVALLADGHFASIDKDQGTVIVETPFDAELASMSAKINETYLPFGERGGWFRENQAAQDANAASLGAAAAAARCSTKGGALYRNAAWDLVDASAEEDFDLDAIEEDALPEAMQTMTPDERLECIATKRQERADLQARIAEVTKQREGFVQEFMKQQALDDEKSFDGALRRAIRAQAVAKGFAFPAIAAR
ncbi:MAG: VWA domain-containing protein [Phycisphaerales bacterium]|nr:VWA domain-containing protein [Phycisphaerae bacterium]NNF43701.1 VWA domain-containing protein [Phycisphaerales bacterium]NNM25461.1 VWA domain-containing protein [Phycisphaerales bacterium]